jgi:hypothetical protein
VARTANALLVHTSGVYTLQGGRIEDGGSAAGLVVAGGTFRGYGDVGLQDELTMSGFVVADGTGTNSLAADRTLSLTNLTGALTNPIENTTSNGWFAVNRGELRLPPVSVGAGSVTVNWGEESGDATVDLVNSVRLAFTGSDGTPLTGALRATDRTDVTIPAGIKKPLSVHAFDGTGFTTAVLTFRYDDARAAAEGVPEADLRVFLNGLDVTAAVDTGANTLTTEPVDALSTFIIGKPVAGTIIWIR